MFQSSHSEMVWCRSLENVQQNVTASAVCTNFDFDKLTAYCRSTKNNQRNVDSYQFYTFTVLNKIYCVYNVAVLCLVSSKTTFQHNTIQQHTLVNVTLLVDISDQQTENYGVRRYYQLKPYISLFCRFVCQYAAGVKFTYLFLTGIENSNIASSDLFTTNLFI